MFEILEFGLCNKFFPGGIPQLIIGFFAVFAAGYLLGSLDFGVIISKALYRGDVREHGSGSAGMTNVLRTYGKLPAALTVLGDGAKTAAAIMVGALVLGSHSTGFYVHEGVTYSNIDALLRAVSQLYGENVPDQIPGVAAYAGYAGMYIGGLAAIVGHAFPVYYKFKGGKSVIATFVTVLFTAPLVALICLMFFATVVAVTKYVSLGSIMSVIVYPLVLYRSAGPGLFNLIAIFIMLFVVFLHRANILRLVNGKENKISFKKKGEKN
ncbi:MAG: glycerol-3-phosphate 1-O-acyltransferase PlsY [Oscillospiraceae bacterium]|nr:glycerol-3-phosphate 1-O-acyltransferase PlsY [Oscillospiraceae bacterium]